MVEEGARAILNLATSPAVEGQTGLYFNGLRGAKARPKPMIQMRVGSSRRLSLELTRLPLRVRLLWSDS